jgi:hypothetical protein
MPILPDSLANAPPPPPSGRRSFAPPPPLGLGAEAPLMQRSARAAYEPAYPRAGGTARVPDPAVAAAAAPPRAESVALWPGRFNAESARGAAAAPPPGRSARAPGLFAAEADFLYPYGHIARAAPADAQWAARGGIGDARRGDKPYHRAEWSDSFQAASAKPHKWHAHPDGPPAKLTWANPAAAGAALAGRPLWER